MEWAAANVDQVNVLERLFLKSSQDLAEKEAREREAQRQRELEAARKLAEVERARAEEQIRSGSRLRQRAVFLSVALILAGVLAGASGNNLQVDPERSVLLALQALEEADTLEARNSLHRAIPELHLLYSVPNEHGGVPDVAYSPDGQRLATAGADGTVRTYTMEIEHLIGLAKARLTRGLTDDECRKFIHVEVCP